MDAPMRDPRSILITGASSGIGEALALAYAAAGIRLCLSGRDAARIEAVAAACRGRGAEVEAAVVDVADRAASAAWIGHLDQSAPIDLVIANAGISAGTAQGGESAEQTRAILSVNVDGVLNTVLPLVPAMIRRRHGQIALMSSLASFHGFAGAPAYCASKAAVRVWGEGLRLELRRHDIGVSVICPGFVESRMSARNDFPMPFLISAEKSARIIRRGLAANRGRIAFPFPTYALVRLLAALPASLTDPLLTRLPKKD
jgi:short-subunit dehydrogenase